MKLIFSACLLVTGLLISSCEDNISRNFNALEFEIIDSIVIELPFEFPVHSFSMSFYSKSDTDFMQLQINKGGGFLVDFDISNREFKRKINISKHLKSRYANPVFFSHVIDSDTTLILQSPSNYNLMHDTVLTVINSKGKLIGAIGINNSLFPSHQNVKKSSNIMLVYQDFSDIEIKNNNVFLRTVKLYNSNCNISDFIKNSFLGGHISIKDNDFHIHDVYYSDTLVSDCDSLEWRLIAWNDSIVYYVFNYSNDIVRYNYQLNKSQQITAKQPELLNIFSIKNELGIISQQYSESFKFESEGLIFRTAYYPKPLNLGMESYENQKLDNLWIGAYDSDFNLIAENTASDKIRWSYPRPKEYNGALYAMKRKRTEDNKVVIYKMKPIITDVAHSEVETLLPKFDYSVQKTKIPLNEFLISKKIPNSSYVLYVPKSSCPSCTNYILDEYISKFNEYTSRNLYLLISKDAYDHYLSKRLMDMDYRANKYIIVSRDEDFENIEFPIDPTNPMIFSIEKNRVKQTFLFNPDQLALFDNFEEQFK